MNKQQIYQDLTRLIDEIDKLPLDNTESRGLHKVVTDIENHLEGREEERGPQDVVDTVDQLISRLEADHPTLTGVLRRIMNTLSSMGI
jgi:hypothetical protein